MGVRTPAMRLGLERIGILGTIPSQSVVRAQFGRCWSGYEKEGKSGSCCCPAYGHNGTHTPLRDRFIHLLLRRQAHIPHSTMGPNEVRTRYCACCLLATGLTHC